MESAPRVSFVYFFTKKYTRKKANGLPEATTTELSAAAFVRGILRCAQNDRKNPPRRAEGVYRGNGVSPVNRAAGRWVSDFRRSPRD